MPVHDPRSDAELLAAFRREPAAFGVFYARHVDAVLRYFGRRVADREAVADLTAETFAAALLSAERFGAIRGEPAAWLFGIARHQLSRHARRGAAERRARQKVGLPALELGGAELEAVLGSGADLLDALPPDQRAAVEARVVDDVPYAEIAGTLGVSEPVVRQRVSRGLGALRRRLREQEGR